MRRAQIVDLLTRHGIAEGRCIAFSKTRYCERHANHFVVFNAQVFTRRERILKQVDLDLTNDAEQLNAAARAMGQNLYVLHEGAPHPFWKPGSTPVRQALRYAVWWTRSCPQDEDVFFPVATALRRPKRLPLHCRIGRWRGQIAYRLDAWGNPCIGGANMFGAAVELRGEPPAGLNPAREVEGSKYRAFMVEPSPTKGLAVWPAFFHKSGPFEYIWFTHGKALPAVLWDNSIGLLERLRFTWHKGHGAIHVHRHDRAIGFVWPCSICAPEVVANAVTRLRRKPQSRQRAIPYETPKKEISRRGQARRADDAS